MMRVAAQRKKNKVTLVTEFGGKCILCDYNKSIRALHFHHVDPSTKSFGLAANGVTTGVGKMREEAKKCVLLCSNCHAEVEDGMHNDLVWRNWKTREAVNFVPEGV